jgi:hypothetical protein
MRTSTHIVSGLFLATAALINIPLAVANNSSNAPYNAYEELSGTHAGKTQMAPAGARGKEGTQGETGAAGAKSNAAFVYDAFEELSGTHATSPAIKAGMRGSSGRVGESGQAGKVNGNWTRFNVPGDVQDGCSKYLRCSN